MAIRTNRSLEWDGGLVPSLEVESNGEEKVSYL